MSGVAMDDVEDEEVVFDQTTLLTRRFKPTTQQEKSGRCARLTQTFLLCCAFFGLGLCIAMPGPTLLDLEARTNTNTSRISQIFTGRSVGYLFGSIVSGFLYDRVNQNCLLSFSLIVTALGTALAPWSKNFTVLMVFIALQGISMGFLDTGGNVFCMTIWGRSSPPYMQALHFSFGLGAFVAPLLAEPFLSKATNVTQLPYSQISQMINENEENNNAGGVSDKTVQRFIRAAPDPVGSPVPPGSPVPSPVASTTVDKDRPKKPQAASADFLNKNRNVADGTKIAGVIKNLPKDRSKKPQAASADFLNKNHYVADGTKIAGVIKNLPKDIPKKPQAASADFLNKNHYVADGTKIAGVIKNLPKDRPKKPQAASADFLNKNHYVADGTKIAGAIKNLPKDIPKKPQAASADFLNKNHYVADGTKIAGVIKNLPKDIPKKPQGKTVQRFIRAAPDPAESPVLAVSPVPSPVASTIVDKDRPKKPQAASADFLNKNRNVADGTKIAGVIKNLPKVVPVLTTTLVPPATDTRNNSDNSTVGIPQQTPLTTTTTLPTTTTTTLPPTTTKPTTTTSIPTTTSAKKMQENSASKSTVKNPGARSVYSLDNSTLSNETESGGGNSPAEIIARVKDVIQTLTNIQFAYLAIAAYLIVIAFCFMIMCCCSRQGIRAVKNQDISESEYMIHKETKGFRVQILVLMFFFYFLYSGMEVTYGGLIMIFAVKYLGWSKAEGTLLTSVFWGSFALARGISIFFGVCLSPALMLIGDLVMTCLSLAGLVMALDSNHIILWFCTAVLGAGMASIFPTGITWAERYMRMTGKATSVLVVGSALGEMFMPALTGYLFETKGPMWLLYIMLGAGLLSAVLYIIMQNLASNKGERYEKLTQWLGSSSTDSGTEDQDMEMDSLASNSTTNLLEIVSPTSNGNGKKKVSFNLPKDINPKSIANKYRPSFLGKNSAKRD